MCIFESDTGKSDRHFQIFWKMIKYLKIEYKLLVYLTSFTVCSGDIRKKSSENDSTSDPNYEKKIP